MYFLSRFPCFYISGAHRFEPAYKENAIVRFWDNNKANSPFVGISGRYTQCFMYLQFICRTTPRFVLSLIFHLLCHNTLVGIVVQDFLFKLGFKSSLPFGLHPSLKCYDYLVWSSLESCYKSFYKFAWPRWSFLCRVEFFLLDNPLQ